MERKEGPHRQDRDYINEAIEAQGVAQGVEREDQCEDVVDEEGQRNEDFQQLCACVVLEGSLSLNA
jgi:hypothetical protein